MQTSTWRFSWAPATPAPIARIALGTPVPYLGVAILFDARGSEGTDLTWEWEVTSSPHGAVIPELVPEETEASAVSLLADQAGPWGVAVTVRDSSGRTARASLEVVVSNLLAPVEPPPIPDGQWPFEVIGSVYRQMEDAEVLVAFWSGLVQLAAADLLRTYQARAGQSIRTVPDAVSAEWVPLPSEYVPSAPPVAWVAPSQQGTDASTVSSSQQVQVAALSAREVLVLSGSALQSSIGQDLVIEEGALRGSYRVNSITPIGTGYLLSEHTLLPSVPVRTTFTGMRIVRGSAVVRDSNIDWAGAGTQVGDLLVLSAGAAGHYRVASFTEDTHTLILDRPVHTTRSGVSGTCLPAMWASTAPTGVSLTSTVYIPQGSLSTTYLSGGTLSASGTLVGPYEVLVSERHLSSSLLGRPLTLLTPPNAGRQATIASLNAAGTGYLLSQPLAGPFPASVRYQVPSPLLVQGRLLVVDGEAHPILGITLDTSLPAVEAGGPGPSWALSLGGSQLRWGREGMAWRLDSTLFFDGATEQDLPRAGLTAGDILMVDVVRTDTGREATLPAVVTGVFEGRISAAPGYDATTAQINGSTWASFYRALGLPRVRFDADGQVVLDRLAGQVGADIDSLSFRSALYGSPVSSETGFTLGGIPFRVRQVRVRRNSRLPLPPDTCAVPMLQEWIRQPDGADEGDGRTIITRDSVVRALVRRPEMRYEGRDYSLQHRYVPLQGVSSTVGSRFFSVENRDLTADRIQPGDTLQVQSGLDSGEYQILSVEAGRLEVVPPARGLPRFTASDLRARVVRAQEGSFLAFHPGTYTLSSRMPEILWAPRLLRSNDAHIEQAFGVLVGLTRDQHEAQSAYPPPYRVVVAALQRGYSLGATPAALQVSLNALAGLPLLDRPCLLRSIHPAWSAGTGLLVVEELNEAGQPSGVQRRLPYPSSGGYAPFSALSTNPQTQAPWAPGDTLPPWTPLCGRVLVEDEGTAPGWWRTGAPTRGRELARFHSFQVLLDLLAVPSSSMGLLEHAVRQLSPVWTSATVQGVLRLQEVVEIEDTLGVHAVEGMWDHPAHSLEASGVVDETNGSGLPLMHLDLGALATRTLFSGQDLVVSAGSAVVSSARGGFTGTPTRAAWAAFPDFPQVDTDTTGPWEAHTDALPHDLVRVGDILRVQRGTAEGWYRIEAVTETTLTVDTDEDLPHSPDPATWQNAEGLPFQILRIEDPVRLEGTGGYCEEDSTLFRDDAGMFWWDGAAVGDWLRVYTGANRGVYRITQLTADDPDPEAAQGETLPRGTCLVVTPALPMADEEMEYDVFRESLRANPLLYSTDFACDGTELVTSENGSFVLSLLRPGDELQIFSGPDVYKTFRVLEIASDTEMYVSPAPSTWSGVVGSVQRRGRDYSPLSSSGDFERPWTEETTEVCIYEPRSLVFVRGDGLLYRTSLWAAPTGDEEGSDSLAGLGMVAGMQVDIGGARVGLTSITGTFVNGETITGGTSGATATCAFAAALPGRMYLLLRTGVVVQGETVTGSTSGATATVLSVSADPLYSGSRVVQELEEADAWGWEEEVMIGTDGSAASTWPMPFSVWDLSEQWELDADTATAVGGDDLEDAGVQAGDVLRFGEGATAVVLSVSGSVLTLTQSTGITSARYAGAVWRTIC